MIVIVFYHSMIIKQRKNTVLQYLKRAIDLQDIEGFYVLQNIHFFHRQGAS